jgi:hypothetical protein
MLAGGKCMGALFAAQNDLVAAADTPRNPHRRIGAETNKNPKSFSSTADPDKIIAAVKRGYQALESIH